MSAESTVVVIVNYEDCKPALHCLAHIGRLERPPLAVIVVDNGSSPENFARLQAGWRDLWLELFRKPPVTVREITEKTGPADFLLGLPENRGFAAGNNSAIRHALEWAQTRAIWLLNSDTLPASDALGELCRELDTRPDCGIAGSTMLYARLPGTVQCAGGGRLNRWLGTTRLIDDGRRLSELAVSVRPDFILGASMLVKREVFESCGLMDENYFLYYEEVDFCLTVTRAGFGLCWARQSMVGHMEGASTGASGSAGRTVRRPAYVDYLSVRNRFYLMKKFFAARVWCALAGLVVSVFRRLARRQAGRLPLLLRAAASGLAGRMGRPDCLPGKRG